ncbi:MAG: glutaredoxin family protein [Gammaproteobacteria bacterium]|nr:glutaredoxin family protein [Gammaproteobacteria bacterium]
MTGGGIPAVRLTLLTREGCGLCEEFADDLARLATTLTLPTVETLNIDSDPELLRRFGHKIPVLLWDGVPVAVTYLDPREIERLVRVRC